MLLFDCKVSESIGTHVAILNSHYKGRILTNMESRDSTCFIPPVLCSISFHQGNSMLAPGFSMSLISRRNSIIIIPSGREIQNCKKQKFKNRKIICSSYKISSGIDREEKPCSTDAFGGDDNCKLAQGRQGSTLSLSRNFFQFTESMRSKFNCTVPWLQYFRKDINICGPDRRYLVN